MTSLRDIVLRYATLDEANVTLPPRDDRMARCR